MSFYRNFVTVVSRYLLAAAARKSGVVPILSRSRSSYYKSNGLNDSYWLYMSVRSSASSGSSPPCKSGSGSSYHELITWGYWNFGNSVAPPPTPKSSSNSPSDHVEISESKSSGSSSNGSSMAGSSKVGSYAALLLSSLFLSASAFLFSSARFLRSSAAFRLASSSRFYFSSASFSSYSFLFLS